MLASGRLCCHFAVVIEPKNINPCPIFLTWPLLKTCSRTNKQLRSDKQPHWFQLIFIGPCIALRTPGFGAKPDAVFISIMDTAKGIDTIAIRGDIKSMRSRSLDA